MSLFKKPIAVWVAIVIAITSLIGIGLYIASNGDEERAQPSSVRVEVAKARRGSLVRDMTVVGTLESANSVVMKAQVKGLITKVNIIGGEEVQKGDVLFEIDDRPYQAQAKEAKALHDLAKAAFEREETLAKKNFGAAKKLEEARAQFLKTQAQLERAEKDLEDTKIVAPFEGFVGLHKISIGTPITADLDLVTITDTDPMKVNFKMPSKFVRYLSVDQKVKIDVGSYPDRKFEGRIEAIDALVDAGAQSIAVQATIPNGSNLLKPGMFVRVKVTVGSKDDSLIVPEESIVAVGDQTYVWRVIENPKDPGNYFAVRVEVLTGLQEKDRMEITRNLREDDIVITIGHQKVANGTPVSFDLESVDLESKESDAESDAPKPEAPKAALETKSISLVDRIKGFFGGEKPSAEAVLKDQSQTESASPDDEKVSEEASKEPEVKKDAVADDAPSEQTDNK